MVLGERRLFCLLMSIRWFDGVRALAWMNRVNSSLWTIFNVIIVFLSFCLRDHDGWMVAENVCELIRVLHQTNVFFSGFCIE